MNEQEARKLIGYQSCITYFMDKFIDEVGSLPESKEREALIQGMKEVIGLNLIEAIMPIIGKFNSLNPYGDNQLATERFKNAKYKYLRDAVRNT